MLSMQHEGRGKAAKVDENVSQWTKICRSTVADFMHDFLVTVAYLAGSREFEQITVP